MPAQFHYKTTNQKKSPAVAIETFVKFYDFWDKGLQLDDDEKIKLQCAITLWFWETQDKPSKHYEVISARKCKEIPKCAVIARQAFFGESEYKFPLPSELKIESTEQIARMTTHIPKDAKLSDFTSAYAIKLTKATDKHEASIIYASIFKQTKPQVRSPKSGTSLSQAQLAVPGSDERKSLVS